MTVFCLKAATFLSKDVLRAVLIKRDKFLPPRSSGSRSLDFRFLEFLRFEISLTLPPKIKKVRFADGRTLDHYDNEYIKRGFGISRKPPLHLP